MKLFNVHPRSASETLSLSGEGEGELPVAPDQVWGRL